MFFLALLLYVGFTIISELLKPKPKGTQSAVGDIQVPTAEEGRAVPVIYGTCHLRAPNVTWYGDIYTRPIEKKQSSLFHSTKYTVGYRYYMAQMLALCMGVIDDLLEVRFDDRPLPNGFVTIDGTNDAIVFGDASPPATYTAHMAHGNYSSLPSVAAAAQTAMRSAYGGGTWRCVYGYEVLASSSDELVYQVRTSGSFSVDEVVHFTPGNYGNGVQFSTSMIAALNAHEALVAGGPRVRFSGSYLTTGLFQIVVNPIRTGVDGFTLRGSSLDYDRSVLPMIGGTLGTDQTFSAMPATWTSTHVTGAKRFAFAYGAEDRKLDIEDAGFTSLAVFGLSSTPPPQAGGRPVSTIGSAWGNVGGSTAAAVLADSSGGTFIVAGSDPEISAGDLCSPATCSVVLGTLFDPGNTTWALRFTGRRHGDGAGQVDVNIVLKAGGTTITSDAEHMAEGFADFALVLSNTEMNNFRSHGGFTPGGAQIDLIGNYGGFPGGGCLSNTARVSTAFLDVPGPPYAPLGHFLAASDREITGVVIVDEGDYFRVTVNQLSLFGGDDGEGGVAGRIDLYKGNDTQVANDYLETVVGRTLPAYRQLCYAVLRQDAFSATRGTAAFYVGNSPYLKAISFVVRRCPNSLALTAGHENVGGDANPAAMIYDILTNDKWGLALPAGAIDAAAFRAAGATLAAEGYGLSMVFDAAGAARDVLSEIVRHVDGVIYVDPESGLVTLTLIRPGAAMLALNRDNVKSCKMSRPAWGDTVNTIKVSYIDRLGNYQERIAQAQDLANIQTRSGEIAEEQYDFRGCSNATMAQSLAARVLKTTAYPLAAFELEVNRAAWPLRPGSVALLTWRELGIVNMAIRVTRIATGSLTDGTIRIDAVEDIFGIEGTGYTLADSSWVDPVALPQSLEAAALIEAPYALVDGAGRFVFALGAFGVQLLRGFQVWDTSDGTVNYLLAYESPDLTPTGFLMDLLDWVGTSIRVRPGGGLGSLESVSDGDFAAGKSVALIGTEFVAWQYVADNGDGTVTLSGLVRGVADTTPAFHGAGDRVWFVSAGAGFTSQTAYDSDVTVRAKLLAYTALGIQALADVSELTTTTTSRAARPYVPSSILIGGLSYPILIAAGDIAVSWQHRNRLAAWSWANAGALAAPEAGTTYNLRFYDGADILRKTYSGLTGTSQTWTTEVADAGRRQDRIRIELEAVVAGVVSYQIFNFTVWRNMAQQSLPPNTARRAAHRRRVRVVDSSEDDL